MKRQIIFALVINLLVVFFLAGCANPGSGPDGGPYDEQPPQILATHPLRGQLNAANTKRVILLFDENIKLDKASEKVTISPPQTIPPEIKVLGRRVIVDFADTLQPSTTYTVDFSDAIQDVTEGNPMGTYTHVFSTGTRLDTMEVAGNVIAATDLEPQKGLLVGLYPAEEMTDSTFMTRPFDRVARTDALGFFSIKGVAPGSYRIFALKDMDGDFKWSRGEMLAFTDTIVTTSCFPDLRHDTVWIDSVRYDSIRTIPYTHFLPDNVVLRAFEERPVQRTLLKYVRETPEKFILYFTAPSVTKMQPVVSGEGFSVEEAFIIDCNETCDTITYWISDHEVAGKDSLRLLLTYDATNDSTYVIEMRTDTLTLIPRLTNARLAKLQAQEDAKWEKELARRHKKGDYTQEQRPVEFLKLESRIGTITPEENLHFFAKEPIVELDTTAFHLRLKQDTTYVETPCRVARDGLYAVTLYGEWRPGQNYRVQMDSAAIVGFSGKVCAKLERSFSVVSSEDVGGVFVSLVGADTSAVVQLLVNDKKILRSQPMRGGSVDFFYVKPGKYFLRLYYDRNNNGCWDTGDYMQKLQPEEVIYYPAQIEVRPDWDTEISWAVDAVPPLRQKPSELQKTKADAKKQSARSKNIERLKQR